MCSRYSFTTPLQQAEKLLQARVAPLFSWQPVYNALPGQWLPVITNEFAQVIQAFRWGLTPQWARDDKMGLGMFNTTVEKILEKPAYKNIFRYKRCLVPADGWYEWGPAPTAIKGTTKTNKQAYRFYPRGNGIVLMAGLWDVRGEGLNSFSIITTAAGADVAPVHNRMPALLTPAQARQWLYKGAGSDDLAAFLRPAPAGTLSYYPVHNRLKTTVDNDTLLLKRVELPKPPPTLF